MNFQSQNNFQASQNQNMNNQAMSNQSLYNQSQNQPLSNQAQLQNEASIAARGYNPQQDLKMAAQMNQKTQGEIQRILSSQAVTGIEFGYIPFPESGPNQMNNQTNFQTQ